MHPRSDIVCGQAVQLSARERIAATMLPGVSPVIVGADAASPQPMTA
jgi:hypothetical protein